MLWVWKNPQQAGNALLLQEMHWVYLERFWRARWHLPVSGGSDCCCPGRHAWRICFTPVLVWGKERQDSSHWKPTLSWEKGKNSFPLKNMFVLLAQFLIYIKHTGYVTIWWRKFLPWGFLVYDETRRKKKSTFHWEWGKWMQTFLNHIIPINSLEIHLNVLQNIFILIRKKCFQFLAVQQVN